MGSAIQDESHPSTRRQPALSPTRWWCPSFPPENDNASGITGTASAFSSSLAPCSPPTGKVPAAMNRLKPSFRARQYGDSTEPRPPALSPCVRSAGGATFSPMRHPPILIPKEDRRPAGPVATALAAQRPQLQPIGQAALDRGDPATKRAAGFTTILTVEANLVVVGNTSTFNGQKGQQTTAPRTGSRWRPAAAAAGSCL